MVFNSACHSIICWHLQDHIINQRVCSYSFKRPRNNFTKPHDTVYLCQLTDIQALFFIIFRTHIILFERFLIWPISPSFSHLSFILQRASVSDLKTSLCIVIFILFLKLKPSVSLLITVPKISFVFISFGG